MENMFGKAKNKSTKKSTKKEEILIVDIKSKEFAEKLEQFANLKSKIDELKKDLTSSQEFVKKVGIVEYAKLINETKSNIGSFVMESETGGSVMFVPTKKYIKIDKSGAKLLKETYGDNIISDDTTYTFNTKILMKNMEEISNLIQGSDKISETDKEKLIEATTTYSIEKDTLDDVFTLSLDTKNEILDVLDDLQPVYQVKSPKA